MIQRHIVVAVVAWKHFMNENEMKKKNLSIVVFITLVSFSIHSI